ncbi:MAG: hypothetical protein M0P71_12815 [Melioribacteraceae bacterium]|jgi:hypothetical protein|nr:hypothetical protein [Melioribacteraceae bacterium]
MKIFNVEEFKIKLEISFPLYSFKLVKVGNNWYRLFILQNKVQLGRISLKPVNETEHEVFYLKHYKPFDYDYDKEDDFFHQFYTWLISGKIIDIKKLIPIAIKNKKRINLERIQWRKEHKFYENKIDTEGNPLIKRRKKLNDSWTGELKKLISEEERKIIKEINNVPTSPIGN